MTKRIAEYKEVSTLGYTKDVPIEHPLPYFKSVATRKKIQYDIKGKKVRFIKKDGSYSNYHSPRKAIYYIKMRRVQR